jgi:hypothetical protein
MPAIHLLPADRFYQLLTTHGVNMLIFWMISFEIAILYFCSSTLLRVRLATPKLAWVGFGLMLAGIIINNAAVATGTASVMMTSYVPMPANPNFYLGLILFAVGALIGCFIFLATLVIAKDEKTYEGSIPLVTFGALTACIIAVFTIASGAIVLVPTWLWSRLVCHRGYRIRGAAVIGKSQPYGVLPLHSVPAVGQCTSSAGGSGPQRRVEDLQYQLCDVPGRSGEHGSRTDGAGLD